MPDDRHPHPRVEVLRAPRARRANATFLVSVGIVAAMTLAACSPPSSRRIRPTRSISVPFTRSERRALARHRRPRRDLLSRLIFGARTALLGLLRRRLVDVLGILLGLLAGWRGGWLDAVLGPHLRRRVRLPVAAHRDHGRRAVRQGTRRPGDRDEHRLRAVRRTAHPLARHRRAQPALRLGLPRAGLRRRVDRVPPRAPTSRRSSAQSTRTSATCWPSSRRCRSSVSACRPHRRLGRDDQRGPGRAYRRALPARHRAGRRRGGRRRGERDRRRTVRPHRRRDPA